MLSDIYAKRNEELKKKQNEHMKTSPQMLRTQMPFRNFFNCEMDWSQFNTGSNLVPVETFAKYGRIDHLWVINPLKSQ